MSTLAELIEKLIFVMDDCKKALSEKELTVRGQVNLCNVDDCIRKVYSATNFTVPSTPKHTFNDYSSLIPNDIEDVQDSLASKGIMYSANLKISQIPDKIREIEKPLSEPYAGDFNDFRMFCSEHKPKNVYFNDLEPPSNVTTYDWSATKDKSVVMYYTQSDSVVVTSRRLGLKVILPRNIESLFNHNGRKKLELVDFSMADFSLVTNMNSLFWGCEKLTTVIADNIDVSNVTNMNYAFYECTSLSSLDLSSWNTKKLESCASLFEGCSNLSVLKLNFNTSNLINASDMFRNCSSLTTLDLSSFDLSYMSGDLGRWLGIDGMFDRCPKLKTIIAKNWADNPYIAAHDSIFYGDTSLPNFSNAKIGGDMCKAYPQGGYFRAP